MQRELFAFSVGVVLILGIKLSGLLLPPSHVLSPLSQVQIITQNGTEAARLYRYQKWVRHTKTGELTQIPITALTYSPQKVRLFCPADERIIGRIKQDRNTGIAFGHFADEVEPRLGRAKIQEKFLPRETWIQRISPHAFYASGNENLGWETTAIHWNEGRLIYGKDTIIEGKKFPCFCIFKDGKVAVEILEFYQNGDAWVPKKWDGELPNLQTAISLKPVMKHGVPLAPEERLPAFVDLRHAFQFPFIGPNDCEKLGVDVEKLMSAALFFGLDKLDRDPELAKQALNRPIQLPKNVTVFSPVGQKSFLTLNDEMLVKIFSADRYERVAAREMVKQRGQYYFDHDSVTVFLKLAPYPHHAIGVTRDGNVVELFIEGKSGMLGVTLEELAAELQKFGVVDGGSVDQGGGIYFWLQGKERIKPQFDTAVSIIIGVLREDLESSL